ncbi:MAG: dephospho-CoA kinase [Acidobacteriaceae bacterium]|jgi:dephospho-CoA kinase
MLRVGLTGDLGSGKSTVARMLAERGAVVLSSDEMGRALMQPGERAYAQIVETFGSEIVAADGSLDRKKLAALAFDAKQPRIEELNAIIHPAVIDAQAEQLAEMEKTSPEAIVVVESALIFSTQYGPRGNWRERFDCVLVVDAPEEVKIARFVDRIAAGRALSGEEREGFEADARRRLQVQHATVYPGDCLVLHNDGDVEFLEQQVAAVWERLQQMERAGGKR